MLYLASKGLNIGANVCESHAVCVSDNRHHETTGRLYRYTDVNVVVLADELSMPGGVHTWHLLQSLQTPHTTIAMECFTADQHLSTLIPLVFV